MKRLAIILALLCLSGCREGTADRAAMDKLRNREPGKAVMDEVYGQRLPPPGTVYERDQSAGR